MTDKDRERDEEEGREVGRAGGAIMDLGSASGIKPCQPGLTTWTVYPSFSNHSPALLLPLLPSTNGRAGSGCRTGYRAKAQVVIAGRWKIRKDMMEDMWASGPGLRLDVRTLDIHSCSDRQT